MYPLRPQLVPLRPAHETLTQALIHHKHHLRRHLRAQKRRLLHSDVFPFGEIVGHAGGFYGGWGLGVGVVVAVVGMVGLMVGIVGEVGLALGLVGVVGVELEVGVEGLVRVRGCGLGGRRCEEGV